MSEIGLPEMGLGFRRGGVVVVEGKNVGLSEEDGKEVIRRAEAYPAQQKRIEKLEAALEWIRDASERPICQCGLKTGTAALKHHAAQALTQKEKD